MINEHEDINKNELDEECIKQESFYHHHSCDEGDKSEEKDAAKTELEILKADVELEIRSMSIDTINKTYKLSIDKITDNVIKALIISNPQVIAASREFDKVKHQHTKSLAIRKSLENRGKMINNLIQLFGQNYYGFIKGQAKTSIPRVNSDYVAGKLSSKLGGKE